MKRLYIPPDLDNKLTQESKTLSETGSMEQVTVLFVDLRGFSHILEKRNVRRVFKILDIYFKMIVSIVKKYGGVVDKYMGDGLMAVWGIPTRSKIDAYNAVRAAIEIRIGMFRLVPELVQIGEVPLEIGIGIGTGPVVAGFVGPKSLRNYTLIGTCVNRAARLQSIAFDNRIFVDNATARAVEPYSFLLQVPRSHQSSAVYRDQYFELEGIYEFNHEFETMRKHPRVMIAKVVGITKASSSKRRAALLKSIGKGGIGVELHNYEDFGLEVGENADFDSRDLSLLGNERVKGVIIRKKELKGSGIFRIQTWDVGVKLLALPAETEKLLQKIFVGSRVLQPHLKVN
jgi:class 3 adenylate cyclase